MTSGILSMNDPNSVGDDRDMSDKAILARYSKANLHAIVMIVPEVFQALVDIPRLIKERIKLKLRIKELEDENADV